MSINFLKLTSVGLLACSVLTACVSNDPYYNSGQKQVLGTLAGAVGGAALGSAFGQGSGKVAAIAGGALLGGFLGNQIGANLDREDVSRANYAGSQALSSGRSTNWSNPSTGSYGYVEPGQGYRTGNGMICKPYTQTIYIQGRPAVSKGTACQNADGSWSVVGG